MKVIHAYVLVIAAVFCSISQVHATNGYFTHGTGIKSRALAGAGVAFPQDAMASATNPAGMAFLGSRWDIGAVLFSPQREYNTTQSQANGFGGAFSLDEVSSENSNDKLFPIPSFGINYFYGL